MSYCKTHAGASTDQGISARTQVDTRTAIIPPREAELLALSMPQFTVQQLAWLRRYDRAVRHEIRRRQERRHERFVDMLVSLVTACSLAAILYIAVLTACL